MIKDECVFILGAGASKPYGYPSGYELVHDLIHTAGEPVQAVMALRRYEQGDIKTFQESLLKSAYSSIDSFLERRADWRDLGKLLTAAMILRKEHEDKLFDGSGDHWYPMLADKLDDDFDSMDFSKITIVTFNYDRSLEQFLFISLCNRHNRPCNEVASKLASLRIIHVYGSVGPLDWQHEGGRKYHPKTTPMEMVEAAKGIQVISEGRDDSKELKLARSYIETARYVFFLGMGYHADNMRRLGFPLQSRSSRDVCGSAFGLSHAQRDVYRSRYQIGALGGENLKCAGYLNNLAYFLEL